MKKRILVIVVVVVQGGYVPLSSLITPEVVYSPVSHGSSELFLPFFSSLHVLLLSLSGSVKTYT